jgi:hypothetical protein
MTSRLIHPRLMQNLRRDFFPQLCTIRQPIEARNPTGEDVPAWEDKPACVSIPCRVAIGNGGERRTSEMTNYNATHTILLAGAFPGIDEKMQAVVDGQIYEIALAGTSAEGAMTRLLTRIVR